MKMTRTAVMARQLRLAFVRQFFDNGTLSKEEAEELLSAPLDPNNKETFVDDKEFLQDPDALEKIAAQLED